MFCVCVLREGTYCAEVILELGLASEDHAVQALADVAIYLRPSVCAQSAPSLMMNKKTKERRAT